MNIKHYNIKVGWQYLLESPNELASACVKEFIRFLAFNDLYDLWFELLESSRPRFIARRADEMFLSPISYKANRELDDQLVKKLLQRLTLQGYDCLKYPLEMLGNLWGGWVDKLPKKRF